MEMSEKELEMKLLEAGNKILSSPPSSSSELLESLELVESYLGGVEQSPSESMKEALVPSTKALISEELLRHSNSDVKVAVASCISEITRITAPDAPYEDDQMKEVFQLIVSSFEKLDDKSSLSYARRTTILETVAKVRSCVVMLDLECDELIAEMFRHFFKTIRDDHPEGVFSSMETIMTLVVEESEEISEDLVLPVLNVLKKENKEILPIACNLGERVIVNCASKLKAHLLQAVSSSGASFDDYSKVLADVSHAPDEFDVPGVADAALPANENMTDENTLVSMPSEKAVEVAMEDDAPPSEEVGSNAVGSPKTATSNGILHKSNEDSSADNENSKKADLDMQDVKADPSETIADSVVSEEPPKPKTEPEKSNISLVTDNSKEANLDMQDEKVKPSEKISQVEFSEDLVKSKTEPEKSNNTSAANDSSKEADLDMQKKKAAPSVTIADSVGSEEPPELKIESEKTNNASAANDDSQKGDPDTHDESVEANETIADSVGSDKPLKSKTKPKKSSKRKRKPKSTRSSTKPLKSVVPDNPMEVVDTPDNQENTKDVDNMQSVDSAVDSTMSADGDEKPSEAVNMSSHSQKETLAADETCSERDAHGKKKENSIQETACDESGKESDIEKESNTKEATGSDSKLTKRGNKKASSASDQEESVPDATDDMKEEEDNTERLEGNSTPNLVEETEAGGNQPASKKKQRSKPTSGKSLKKTPPKDAKNEAVVLKSTLKASEDESDMDAVLKSSYKRKRSNLTKASKVKIYGEELVGARIKVFWPDDKQFYSGTVDSFDSAEKKHTVNYDDGEIEVLILKDENWKFIDLSEVHGSGAHNSGDEMPTGKKAKTTTSAKKSGASSSRSKSAPKSGSKQDSSKISAKSKEVAFTKDSKSDKLIDFTTKLAKKPKSDDTATPKVSTKPKQDVSKGGLKSKTKTSKSEVKTISGASGSKFKAGISKIISESEDENESSEPEPEPEKTSEKPNSKPQSASKSQKNSKKQNPSLKKKINSESEDGNGSSEPEPEPEPEPEKASEKPKSKPQSASKSQKNSKKRKRKGW